MVVMFLQRQLGLELRCDLPRTVGMTHVVIWMVLKLAMSSAGILILAWMHPLHSRPKKLLQGRSRLCYCSTGVGKIVWLRAHVQREVVALAAAAVGEMPTSVSQQTVAMFL